MNKETWIPVEDSLPVLDNDEDEYVQVLVCTSEVMSLGTEGMHGTAQTYKIAMFSEKHTRFFVNGVESDIVSHWIALPELPDVEVITEENTEDPNTDTDNGL